MERSIRKYRLNLRIAPGDLQVVKRVADIRGVSIQEVIRDCVGEWALRHRHMENSEKASALFDSFVSDFNPAASERIAQGDQVSRQAAGR